MSQLPSHNPEDIAAWVDGELPAEAAAALQQRASVDPQLAAQAQRIRRIDDLLRQAVPPSDAVPADVLERLGLQAAPAANVFDMGAAREARRVRMQPERAASRHWPMMRVAAQVLLVAGLGTVVAVWQVPGAGPDAAYRTLSNSAAPVAANGVVMFAKGIDAASANAIAAEAGGQLVGSPNAAGAWQLSLPTARRDAALAALRADRRVLLAQPLDGPPS